MSNNGESGVLNSPFDGTPWNNDDEIYDFVIEKKFGNDWDWDSIKASLLKNGLNEEYADAIIANIRKAGREEHNKTIIKGVAHILLGILVAVLGYYITFINNDYELTSRGYIIWIIGSIALIIYGVIDLNKKY